MISVVLIGTGNVAQNMFHAFFETPNVVLEQVVGRRINALDFAMDKTKTTTDFNQILKADIYVLAVSDDAISAISEELRFLKGLIVHTSGGTPMDVLHIHDRYGVFYPLQTFTKGKIISFKSIPMCIEANAKEDLRFLETLGSALSTTVTEISSEQRNVIHVAAVFVNNFTNYMYTIGEEICTENGLDFNLLKPLIKETAAKLSHLSPLEAQTGPAKRGDQQTLHNHLTILKKANQRELYIHLSNEIKRKHGEKL